MKESQYKVLFNNATRDYNGTDEVEVGRIVNCFNNEIICYIIYDKFDFQKKLYRIRSELVEYEDGTQEFRIVLGDQYRKLLYNKYHIFCAIAFHELGHFINGDLTRKDINQTMLNEERVKCILHGKVQSCEIAADKFAVEQIGKNRVMQGIDYLIKQRKERNDDGMDLAIKEFKLRKKQFEDFDVLWLKLIYINFCKSFAFKKYK